MLQNVLSLQDQLAEAHETIRQLKALIVPPLILPPHLGLKYQQNRLVVYLMERSPHICSKEQVYNALYLDRRCEPRDLKNVDVQVYLARKALREIGAEILTHFGLGYSMPAESAAKLREL